MNFDVELASNAGGTVIVKQVYPSKLQTWWKNDVHLAHIILVVLGIIVSKVEGIAWVTESFPSAVVFYLVRTLVDKRLGIKWYNKYRHFP